MIANVRQREAHALTRLPAHVKPKHVRTRTDGPRHDFERCGGRDKCGGETYLSTDPARARITRQAGDRWLLEWEDWADGDFNDSMVLIEVE